MQIIACHSTQKAAADVTDLMSALVRNDYITGETTPLDAGLLAGSLIAQESVGPLTSRTPMMPPGRTTLMPPGCVQIVARCSRWPRARARARRLWQLKKHQQLLQYIGSYEYGAVNLELDSFPGQPHERQQGR